MVERRVLVHRLTKEAAMVSTLSFDFGGHESLITTTSGLPHARTVVSVPNNPAVMHPWSTRRSIEALCE